MRHGVRRGERVHVLCLDYETGRQVIQPTHVRGRYVDGVTFSVDGGALYFTTEEGTRWCRDDSEDLAALSAAAAMADSL